MCALLLLELERIRETTTHLATPCRIARDTTDVFSFFNSKNDMCHSDSKHNDSQLALEFAIYFKLNDTRI